MVRSWSVRPTMNFRDRESNRFCANVSLAFMMLIQFGHVDLIFPRIGRYLGDDLLMSGALVFPVEKEREDAH